jgi:crossover junction endodeoxyribonuclease RuvC
LQADSLHKRRILGIDPGTQITGVGIIDFDNQGELSVCYYGSIKTIPKSSLPIRLKKIYKELIELINKYKPDFIALEDIFYSENIKTAIVMGHARAVAILAPINLGIEPTEYSPREVKLAVVGRGNASKSQVQYMVRNILKINEEINPPDAADALAVAICHFNRLSRAEYA